MSNNVLLDKILSGLMDRYKSRVPDVQTILQAMLADGLITKEDDIENDHVAFRTIGVPLLGIQSLEKIFLHCGYTRRDAYHFEAKKIDAFWYAPPQNNYPRIFISELKVDSLSDQAQAIIKKYTQTVTQDPVSTLNLDDWKAVDAFLHSALWDTPTWEEYQTLRSESEYAAWTIYNRYYLNHFTISVHNLPGTWGQLENFNAFLQSHGIVLNDAGGIIKASDDGKLRQSSTVAKTINAEFPNTAGTVDLHPIAGSYVEFAERAVLDEFLHLSPEQVQRHHRRDGFETGNADKIFESTYTSQTEKKRG